MKWVECTLVLQLVLLTQPQDFSCLPDRGERNPLYVHSHVISAEQDD